VEFTTDEVTLWQAFRRMPSLSTLCIIPQVLNTHISFIYNRLFITLAFDSCTNYFTSLSNSSSLWNINHKNFSLEIKYINNCPTSCNTKQSIYYSASSLYMFRVSTSPIIRSTQNCNYSLRYCSYFLCAATYRMWWYQMLYNTILTSWWWAK